VFYRNQTRYINIQKKYRGVPPTFIPRVIILIVSSISCLKLKSHNFFYHINILWGYKMLISFRRKH